MKRKETLLRKGVGLEKYAHALEVPLYRLFTDEHSVKVPKLRQFLG
jgi:hypothetical protein